MTFSGWQTDVQPEFAVPIYHQIWEQCEVIENDSRGADGEKVARLLDYGDVDKIIRVGAEQVFMAQRFRKPYWDSQREEWREPDMTLRYSRPNSDRTIEYERLMSHVGSDRAMYPSRYAFGRVNNDHTEGIYELYILDTDRLINAIRDGDISEKGPIPTAEGQEFMSYSVDEIETAGAVEHSWTKDAEVPDNPGSILSWCEVGK